MGCPSLPLIERYPWHLSANNFRSLLSDETLQVASERVASDAILRWAEHHQCSGEELAGMERRLRASDPSPPLRRLLPP